MKGKGARALHRWLEDDRADRPVAWCGERTMTLAMMRQQVSALCAELIGMPQKRWALCFEDSYLFTVALLAALHAGKTPIVPGHCRQSLLEEQASSFDGLIADVSLSLNCPMRRVEPPSAQRFPPLPPVAADAEVVLFTSGSTGAPREIHKPIACLDTEAQWLAALWGERLQGCSVIASVTHQHLYGLTFRIMLPMALALPFDSRQVLYSEQLAAQPGNRRYALISSPAFLRRIDLALQPPRCPLIVSAGGELPWASADAAQKWFGQPVDEIYGSTETGVLAWRSRHDDAVPWNKFAQVSFQRDEADIWHVRSPLIPQPQGLKLDDRLDFSSPSGFRLCGRHDRIVKIEDKRISLSDIERRLLAQPDIADAAALQIIRHGRSGVGVVVVLKPGEEIDLAQRKRQWKTALRRWLEPVAMPRFWRVVETIPHNSQSKRAWPQIKELFDAAG